MPDDDNTLLTQNNTDGADKDQAAYDALSPEDKAAADEHKAVEDQAVYDALSDEDKAKADADKAKDGTPEEYADFTFPDGVEADQGLLDDFKPLAKELNLTQEQAQKLVDLQVKNIQANADAQQDAFKEIKEGWTKEVKADEETGGADYKEKVGVAVKAISKFGSDAFRKLLDDSGFGNHPEMVRCFYKIGKVISEDKFVDGDKVNESKPFYDKSNHNT